MNSTLPDYEKLGSFYLGKDYDLETKEVREELVMYDSRDLVTHGVVLGMTGSGKTGLCIALLEEAAMDNVPAIVIDPKGDISNLLLQFPELSAEDFRPWINEDDAAKKGVSPEEFAARTAETWRNGLADWGQGPDRIAALKEKVDINIFTPGSKAGIPVSILSSLEAPPFEIVDDGELLGERIESTVSSLLSLVGVDADPIQSPEAILLSNIFASEWRGQRDISLETLIRHIQKPPFDKVGIIDLESFCNAKTRQTLALKFNNLLASPGFSSWLEGPPLDIRKMLHAPDGKPRISIFSISHLSDSERMFFVSLLLNQMLGWMRAQGGTTSLRALLYMDEIYGFLPPTANPPSKKPMMTMLKQARAFGLGCLLATQNPVDLDYKALSNIGTWFLGRLQTERDKLRVLDGLEGAAGSQNARFDRASMEKLLSGLGNRVFLMNNVHEDGPVLFHVRWVMSYLTGPLTRGKIKRLMDPKRGAFEDSALAPSGAANSSNPMAMPTASTVPPSARPIVGNGVIEKFQPVAGASDGVIYRPHLLRVGAVTFSSAKADIETTRKVRMVNPITADGIDWDEQIPPPLNPENLGSEPDDSTGFAELPGFAMNASNYRQVDKDFSDWLYRNERAEIFVCKDLKEYSKIGESEAEFRTRLSHAAREARDAAVEKLRDRTRSKLSTLADRLRSAEARLSKEKAEASSAKMQAATSVLGGLLGGLLGRKTRRSSSSAISRSTQAYKQQQDVSMAEDKIEGIQNQISELEATLATEIAELDQAFAPTALDLETETLKPTRANVQVDTIGLLWLPYDERGDRA
ncbi:ATP-binding protein [Haloferula chungangensis]|uniref:ATP-binding protein n=1 Tax=Haloferula chungangensis TaxID=1048331 RepID=A0ABW2LBW5_9BACT